VIIWDLSTGDRRQTVRFDAPVTSADLHPRNRSVTQMPLFFASANVLMTCFDSPSKLFVVTLQGQEEAVFVDLRSGGGRWELELSDQAEDGDEVDRKRK
jgi:COMPASS component SWD1